MIWTITVTPVIPINDNNNIGHDNNTSNICDKNNHITPVTPFH